MFLQKSASKGEWPRKAKLTSKRCLLNLVDLNVQPLFSVFLPFPIHKYYVIQQKIFVLQKEEQNPESRKVNTRHSILTQMEDFKNWISLSPTNDLIGNMWKTTLPITLNSDGVHLKDEIKCNYAEGVDSTWANFRNWRQQREIQKKVRKTQGNLEGN